MKSCRTLLFIALALALALAAPAQVTISAPVVPNFNANSQQFPYNIYTVTVTGTGNATITIPGFSSGSVEIFGNYSAATLALTVANDANATSQQFGTLRLWPFSGGQPITSLTGANTAINGLYSFSASGFNQIKITSSGTFTGTSATLRFTIHAASGVTRAAPLPAADPCQDPNVQKQSLPVAISTATTTALVAPSAGIRVYPCEISLVIGASTTVLLVTGTGPTCGTGTASVSGTVPASTYYVGFGGTFLNLPLGNGLCLTSTGTGGINGTVTYATAPY